MDEVRTPGMLRPTQIVADEAWAWTSETEAEPEVEITGQRVTAVLVTHNADSWLSATLQSLGALTHRPNRFLAVDTGSADNTLQILQSATFFDMGVSAGVRDGFGQGIAKALKTAEDHLPAQPDSDDDWLWLLHDDITVEPDVLRRLLECAVRHPEADIIGPKLLQPGRGGGPRRISELGVSISDTARRELGLEPGEIDQRQHASTEVLAVSTCGLLVRRKVFDALGGLAPELPVFRDGVDFGWRATAAGYHVRTCPEAVITHRQAGRSGLRRSRIVGRDPHSIDRLLGMRTVAAHRGRFASVRLIWGGLLRALGFLLAKAPDLARSELRAVGAFFDPAPVTSLRARVRRPVDAEAAARVRSLRPPWWSSWSNGFETATRAITERFQTSFGSDTDTSIDELTGDDFSASADRPQRSAWSNPLVISLILLVIATLVAARGLLRPGFLHAERLLPARSSLGEVYRAYLDPIIGSPGMSAPPWLGWTAIGSTLTFGQPDWFLGLFLIGGPILALLSAMLLLRRVVADRRIRVLTALTYAITPILLGPVNRGLIAVAVIWVLLPLLAVSIRALALRRTHGPESWRAAWSTGLLLSIILAFIPALTALVIIAAVVAVIVWRTNRARLLRLGVALGVPVVLLAPWLPSIVRSWSRLLVGPDSGLGTLAVGEVWQLMIGRTPGPGLPPLWLSLAVFAALWLLALFAAAIGPGSRGVRAAWLTALGAFALALVLSRQLATVLPQGTRVRPEVTAVLLVGFAALLVAIAIGADRIPAALTTRSFGLAHLGTGLAGLLAIAVLLTSTGWWVWAGATGPIKRTELDELAPYLRNSMLSDARTRTLAIDFDGDVPHWTLIADDQSRLGDADRGLAFGGSGSMQHRTDNMVARLISGAGDDRVAEDLTTLAVAHIWVRGATPEQRSAINNTPGLGAASGADDILVWTVPATRGRMVVTGGPEPLVVPSGPGGRAAVDLPTSDRPRQLTIFEPTDPRWVITFNGNALPVTTGADRTIVDLPPNAGSLKVAVSAPIHPWVALAQLLAIIVLAVLAAPSWAGRRGAAEPASARRSNDPDTAVTEVLPRVEADPIDPPTAPTRTLPRIEEDR